MLDPAAVTALYNNINASDRVSEIIILLKLYVSHLLVASSAHLPGEELTRLTSRINAQPATLHGT